MMSPIAKPAIDVQHFVSTGLQHMKLRSKYTSAAATLSDACNGNPILELKSVLPGG